MLLANEWPRSGFGLECAGVECWDASPAFRKLGFPDWQEKIMGWGEDVLKSEGEGGRKRRFELVEES
jgi:hypothetical protein